MFSYLAFHQIWIVIIVINIYNICWYILYYCISVNLFIEIICLVSCSLSASIQSSSESWKVGTIPACTGWKAGQRESWQTLLILVCQIGFSFRANTLFLYTRPKVSNSVLVFILKNSRINCRQFVNFCVSRIMQSFRQVNRNTEQIFKERNVRGAFRSIIWDWETEQRHWMGSCNCQHQRCLGNCDERWQGSFCPALLSMCWSATICPQDGNI